MKKAAHKKEDRHMREVHDAEHRQIELSEHMSEHHEKHRDTFDNIKALVPYRGHYIAPPHSESS